MNKDKLARMAESVRTGGKGSIRRKRKVQHKSAAVDEKKLQSSLKRLGVQSIGEVQEVNMFKDDQTILHFKNPKVSASISSNTFVISGAGEIKKMQDLLPGILSQLGPDHLASLKSLQEQFAASKASAADAKDGDDDDVPDLVANFDDAAQ
eukprot:TRINITY_DN799_c0_g1_i2.p4 TRINITY_DN799_c0_g1~~TRINITY_DN799_c0_g1_i2.p4  ORF type:complete len:151 (+),score=40.36 TRINITY_DN799_c0_g1_i2:1143-1595(+)